MKWVYHYPVIDLHILQNHFMFLQYTVQLQDINYQIPITKKFSLEKNSLKKMPLNQLKPLTIYYLFQRISLRNCSRVRAKYEQNQSTRATKPTNQNQ